MLGKRTVRSPRAIMALARTTGRAERSSTVNISRMFSSHTVGLEGTTTERQRFCYAITLKKDSGSVGFSGEIQVNKASIELDSQCGACTHTHTPGSHPSGNPSPGHSAAAVQL